MDVEVSVSSPFRRLSTAVSRRVFLRAAGGALAVVAIPGCGNSSESSTGPRPTPPNPSRLTARPGIPTQEPTVGLSQLRLGSSGDGLLYVPESYSTDTPAPLFVGLHGAGGTASDWAPYYPRAEERGMIVLAIDSSVRTWDLITSGAVGPDARSLDLALQHTFDRLRIDATRLALAGFSDGASYALSLGPVNGDLFSHLVAYSPGIRVALGPLTGRPRIYISHGTSDPVIPASNTRDSTVPTLRDSGYDVTFNEFGGGHSVPDSIIESSLNWFLV